MTTQQKMKQQILPKKMEHLATKSRHRSTSRLKEKKSKTNFKAPPLSSIEIKNKFKTEIEMDSTPTMKNL